MDDVSGVGQQGEREGVPRVRVPRTLPGRVPRTRPGTQGPTRKPYQYPGGHQVPRRPYQYPGSTPRTLNMTKYGPF